MRKIIKTKKYNIAQKQQWRDSPGNISAIIDAKDLDDIYPSKQPIDLITKSALRNLLQSNGIAWKPGHSEEAFYQLEIIFSSSGYNDPGRMWGDNAYPPEGDEERIVNEVFLTAQYFNDPNIDGKTIDLPQPIAVVIGEHFRDDIDSVELDPNLTSPEDLL